MPGAASRVDAILSCGGVAKLCVGASAVGVGERNIFPRGLLWIKERDSSKSVLPKRTNKKTVLDLGFRFRFSRVSWSCTPFSFSLKTQRLLFFSLLLSLVWTGPESREVGRPSDGAHEWSGDVNQGSDALETRWATP